MNYSIRSIDAIGKDTDPDSGRLKGIFVSKNVVNLFKRELTEHEVSLLSKGFNFVPTPLSIDTAVLKEDHKRFGRILRSKWHFRDSEQGFSSNPFKPKSNFNPPKTDAAIEIYLSRLCEDLICKAQSHNQNRFNNLTINERAALRGLMADTNIIIKGADKGSAVVVWDREDYLREAESQLGDCNVYDKVSDPLPAINKAIKSCITDIKKRRDIPLETLEYFTINNPRHQRLFVQTPGT